MRLTRHLYFWVLLAILVGGTIGYVSPETGVALKPLGDGFIALIKMLIAPIIFCTVVLGIAGAGNMKKVGRVGGKALLYFEVVSTIALVIGLIVANVLRPGDGFNADPASLDAAAVAGYAKVAASQSTVDFVLNIIPRTFFDAFTGSGDLLQVLFVAVLFGYAMTHLGQEGNIVHQVITTASHVFFRMMNALMMLAPIGAGGAMAFTIGRYGVEALKPLAFLMGSFYLTCLLFIFVVLGTIAAITGFSIFRFIAYIKEELLTVLGTSSSESALVPLMQKLERLGCSKSVVGLVVPAGYSFNLDGTNIYLTMAALFVAQALNIELTRAPAVDDYRCGDADVQGSIGSHRRGIHHARRHARRGAVDPGGGPGADPRRRSVHVRSQVAHELCRQRCRGGGGGALGKRARYGRAATGAQFAALSRFANGTHIAREEIMMLRIPFITLFITVATAATGFAQGLGALSASSFVSLDTHGSRERAAFEQGTTQPKRDSRLNGFLIGFVAGAVPGVIFGMGMSRYCENEARSCPAAVPVAGALFGLIGGGIGYAIDGAVGESRTLARPRPSPGVRFSVRF